VRRQPLQLALRSVMVIVALTALNLSAVVCVWRTRPREAVWNSSMSTGGVSIRDFPLYGLKCRFAPAGGHTAEVTRVLREPLPSTLPEIWAPVIGSTSITLLVLALFFAGPVRLQTAARSGAEGVSVPRSSEWLRVATYGTIAVALVGLNFAAAVYSPPLSAAPSELARHYFKGGSYLIRPDGDFAFVRPGQDLVFIRQREVGMAQPGRGSAPPTATSGSVPIKVRTIVVGGDGSVLGYAGRPGEESPDPMVLRGPSRSLLTTWCPVIASAIVTAVVAALQWLRSPPNQATARDSRGGRDSTRGTDLRCILKWAVVGFALVGLNGAGATSVWKARARERASRVRLVERQAWGPIAWDEENWDIRFWMGKLSTGEMLVRVMWLARRPSTAEVWSPLAASASASLLLLTMLLGRTSAQGRRGSSDVVREPAEQRSPFGLMRCAMVGTALIALNVAAFMYGRFPEPGEEWPCPKVFDDPAAVPDWDGSLCVRDGSYRIIKRAVGGAERLATARDYPLPRHRFDSRTRVKDSVVYRRDGSVVAYEGNPSLAERLISQPRIIYPSTRSFLAVWRAMIVSVSFSLVTVFAFWRQTRRRCPDPKSQGGARHDSLTALTCAESSS